MEGYERIVVADEGRRFPFRRPFDTLSRFEISAGKQKMMKRPNPRSFLPAVLFTAFAVHGLLPAIQPAIAAASARQNPDPAITQTRVLAEVTEIDASGKRVVVKTDAGNIVIVLLDDKTEFLRVPPGEKSLDKAIKTTLAEVAVGDKIYARGRVSEDHKSVPAQTLVVMSKGDIQKRHEQERLEWRRRGISGVVSALNADAREITIQARSLEGVKAVVVAVAENTQYRRYAPDSVKFADASSSLFVELKVGDQLRALGNKSADGARFTAEQIVFGTFRTIGGTVKSVSPDSKEIKVEMLGSKQPLTVVINADSMLRRIPPQSAMFLAMRGQAGAAGGTAAGTGARPQGPPAGAQGGQPSGAAPAGAAPAGRPGMQGGPGSGPRMEGGGDFQDMLERMPPVTLTEIKPGDVIAVSSTVGADASRLTAITLVTGVDAVLAALQSAGMPRRTVNLSTGLPAGVLDLGISPP